MLNHHGRILTKRRPVLGIVVAILLCASLVILIPILEKYMLINQATERVNKELGLDIHMGDITEISASGDGVFGTGYTSTIHISLADKKTLQSKTYPYVSCSGSMRPDTVCENSAWKKYDPDQSALLTKKEQELFSGDNAYCSVLMQSINAARSGVLTVCISNNSYVMLFTYSEFTKG